MLRNWLRRSEFLIRLYPKLNMERYLVYVYISVTIFILMLLLDGFAYCKDMNANSNVKTDKVPEKKQMKFTLSARSRYESLNNMDFRDKTDDWRGFVAQKWRMTAETIEKFHSFFEMRFVRPTIQSLNTIELSQLFFDLGKDLVFRAGRQEILYGDGRIIWNPPWSNEGIFFDGLRMMWKPSKQLQVDAVAIHPVPYHQDQDWGNEVVYGNYTTWKPNKNNELNVYYLYNLRKGMGTGWQNLMANNIGIRYKCSFNSMLSATFEGTQQFGRNGNKDLNAYAYFLKMQQKFKAPWEPSIGVKYDFASGDTNPRGPLANSYIIMYGTRHAIFGNMDIVGQKNVRDLAFNLSLKPAKNLLFMVNIHNLQLASALDAWYLPRGQVLMSDPTGRWGTDMGKEIDYEIKYTTKQWELWAGYSHFTPGTCVEILRKGQADAADGCFFSVEYKMEI